VRLHDGSIRNAYTLKIANKTFATAPVDIAFSGVPGAVMNSPGEAAGTGIHAMVAPNQVLALRVFVTAPPNGLTAASLPAEFVARAGSRASRTQTVFLSGVSQ
jgi:hypothetical protein